MIIHSNTYILMYMRTYKERLERSIHLSHFTIVRIGRSACCNNFQARDARGLGKQSVRASLLGNCPLLDTYLANGYHDLACGRRERRAFRRPGQASPRHLLI